MAIVILNHSTILRRVVSLTLRPLYSLGSGMNVLVTGCLSLLKDIDHMKFAVCMAVLFVTFFHILLVLYCIIECIYIYIYMFVCFCLIL